MPRHGIKGTRNRYEGRTWYVAARLTVSASQGRILCRSATTHRRQATVVTASIMAAKSAEQGIATGVRERQGRINDRRADRQ